MSAMCRKAAAKSSGRSPPCFFCRALRSSSSTPTEPRSQRPVVAPGPRRRWVSRTRSEIPPARAPRQWVSPTRYEEHFCEHVQPFRRTAGKGGVWRPVGERWFPSRRAPTACETWPSVALALDWSRTPMDLRFAGPEPSKASCKATCKLAWPSVTSRGALRTPKQEPVQSQEQCPGRCVVLMIMGGRLSVDCTPSFQAKPHESPQGYEGGSIRVC